MKNGKTVKIIKKSVTVLLSAAVVLAAVAVGYLTYCNVSGKVAFIGNYATVKVITPSMEPTIPTGTYILTKKASAQSVKEGDVIMFYSRDPQIYGKLNTHRVVKVIGENGNLSFITRGDNNLADDDYPVNGNDVLGKYVKNANALTVFADFFTNPVVFFLLVIIPAAALVVVSMMDVVNKAKEARMKALVEEEIKRMTKQDLKEENTSNVEEIQN